MQAQWTKTSFEYTGSVQTFTAPETGNYRIELWGAQGGNEVTQIRGAGGYTSGVISLLSNSKLYVYVGEKPASITGGWNGGGNSSPESPSNAESRGGGGATDIRIDSTPNSRIMVAGGGGGQTRTMETTNYTEFNYGGGDAGGLDAYRGGNVRGSSYRWSYGGYGGNQTDGGAIGTGESGTQATAGTFAYGGTGGGLLANPGSSNYSLCLGSGGGGGWYGGGGGGRGSYGGITGDGGHAGGSGGGGSSYISGHTGSVGVASTTSSSPKSGCTTGTTNNDCSLTPYVNPATNASYKFTNTVMIDGAGYAWTNTKGSLQAMPNPNGGNYASGVGHNGNGYARITYLGN